MAASVRSSPQFAERSLLELDADSLSFDLCTYKLIKKKYHRYIKNRVSDPHFFFADPDPGKNFDADPDPGGIRGRGLGVKGKNEFFLSFFHVSDDS